MDKNIETLFEFLEEHKAKDIALFDAKDMKCDENFIVLANLPSCLENKSFIESLMAKYKIEVFPEGYNKGEWIVTSLGGILLHTFVPIKREKYNLDKLYQNLKINLKKNPKK